MPSLEETLAGVLLASLLCYALLGGADYGGGVWDLLATGPRRQAQRDLIAAAIGPIWEANHVWLILCVVLLFTGFPRAFATVSIALHIPLLLVLLGVVLRGSAFTFRSYDDRRDRVQRRWGAIFAVASLVTPILLGVCVGAVAAGRVELRHGLPVGGFVRPWLAPFPLALGGLALSLFSLLAAVYLTLEAVGQADLQEDFRRRALGALGGTWVLALACWALAPAPLGHGLRSGTLAVLPAFASSILCGVSLGRRRFALARLSAAAQLCFMLGGWALAQYPYLLPPSLTIADAAAPAMTLRLLLLCLAGGAVLLLPSFYYLFRVFKGRPGTS